MGFSRETYWSGLPFLSPGDLPDPGIEPGSPALQVDALPFEFRGNLFYEDYPYIQIAISLFPLTTLFNFPKLTISCLNFSKAS